MFSELLFIFVFSRIITQNSALWMSLLLIPSSMTSMLGWGELNILSGVIFLVVVMVFIGGLLILLVSVASTVDQEQSSSVTSPFMLMVITLLGMSVFETKIQMYSHYTFMMTWLGWGVLSLLLLCVVLLISLMLMTWLALTYKGSLRGL